MNNSNSKIFCERLLVTSSMRQEPEQAYPLRESAPFYCTESCQPPPITLSCSPSFLVPKILDMRRSRVSIPQKIKSFWSRFNESSKLVFQVLRPYITSKRCILAVFIMYRLLAVSTIQWRAAVVPTNHIRQFASQALPKLDSDQRRSTDWKFEEYLIYPEAVCHQAVSASNLQEDLHKLLLAIPREARLEIIAQAVREKQTAVHSINNSVRNVLKENEAFLYYAFWSTTYSPGGWLFVNEQYSTCIVAVAIALSTTTDISGFTPKSDNVQIGTEPCYCGFFFCAKCPIFSEQEARLPIYNHHKIPKEIEERLEEWMVRNAVQKVNKLFSA